VLRERYPDWGRQAVDRLIDTRRVLVNGRTVWLASWLINNLDTISVSEAPAAKPVPFQQFEDAWLLAEDADLLVVNKPAGLLSESPSRRTAPNLLSLAEDRFGPLTLLHRLDRDTSGVVILTRSVDANRTLTQAFQTPGVAKHYIAIVRAPNRLDASGVIDAHLAPHPSRRDLMAIVTKGGRTATTRYAVLGSMAGRQFVSLWPTTGRMHQLRVHLASMGAPILGDRLYGIASSAKRLMLHAYQITIPLPDSQPRTFSAPLPPEFTFPGVILEAS
jgi:23S rRNA pseudouridine1911/1915/1917 synthase